jgi:hypothetical protein
MLNTLSTHVDEKGETIVRAIEDGWKVFCTPIRISDSRLYPVSSCTHPREHESGWLIPDEGCGPLAVFASKQQALDFMSASMRLVLKRVKFVRSKIQDMQWSRGCRLIGRSGPGWHADGYEVNVLTAESMPEGKILADAVYVMPDEEE